MIIGVTWHSVQETKEAVSLVLLLMISCYYHNAEIIMNEKKIGFTIHAIFIHYFMSFDCLPPHTYSLISLMSLLQNQTIYESVET